MKKTKSYTLAEVLIAMTVVGIIAAVSIPTITKLIPDKNTAMIRKAYYVVDNIVQELINDKYYYPDATGNCYDYIEDDGDATTPAQMVGLSSINGCYYGFDNRVAVKIHGTDRVVEGDEKFIALFVSKLNTKKDFEEILWDDEGNFRLGDFSHGNSMNSLDVETEDGTVFHFTWYKMDDKANDTHNNNAIIQNEEHPECVTTEGSDHFRWRACSSAYGSVDDMVEYKWSDPNYNIIKNTIYLDVNGNKPPNAYPKRDGATAGNNNRCRNINGSSPWAGGLCTNSMLFRNVKEERFDTIKLDITRDGKVLVPDDYSSLAKILDNSKNMTK